MRRQRPVQKVAGAVAFLRVSLGLFLRVTLGVALGVCLAGCGGPVAVQAPTPSPACRELMADLPDLVGDQERREVEDDRAAAYGDPPILLRCGGDRPPEVTTNCNTIEGVDWYSREEDAGLRVFTVGREPVVEVWIPARYGISAAPLVDVADAVKGHTEIREPCPG